MSSWKLAGTFIISITTTATAYADGWPMRSHDVRRTGRATVNGPRKGAKVWTYVARDGVSINIEAAVTRKGVFFGTWGLMRRYGNDKTKWDKCDGKIYGLNPLTGKPLWAPLHPGLTPYAYRYAGRKPGPQDKPAGPGLHWNFYNGTVEGTAAVDPIDGTLYVGRGDGVLYAIDPARGKVRWRFHTLDPARPKDPEGGGEVVGGPLVTSKGRIIFATFAAPHRPSPPKRVRNETNAVYAIDRKGRMLWRYPRQGTLEAVFVAPPALSVNGRRVYAVTGLQHKNHPCEFLAFDVASGKLAWRLDLGQLGGTDMAVGVNGIIYVGGSQQRGLGDTPVVFAVADQGKSGKIIWGPEAMEGLRPRTHFVGGIALLEQNRRVVDLYVSTTLAKAANGIGGKLHRVDPGTGKVTATWDPEQAAPKCVGGMTDVSLDKDGIIYVGVRGRLKTLLTPEAKGRMYALRRRNAKFEVLWSHETAGQIDWASPAIGPRGGLYFGTTAFINPVAFILTHPPQKDVKDADPVFYGIRD